MKLLKHPIFWFVFLTILGSVMLSFSIGRLPLAIALFEHELDKARAAAALKETLPVPEQSTEEFRIRESRPLQARLSLDRHKSKVGIEEAGDDSGQQPEAISLTHHVQHLEHLVSESLYGKVFVNDWMDTIAEFVQFPLSPVPVENWRDESEEAFQFLIGEKDLEAYLTIDKEDGRIGLRVEDRSAKLIEGVYRRGSELCMYFGRGDGGELQDYSLQSYAKLSLGVNRRNGIEAYKGSFKEGIIYQDGQAFQFGIVDGKPVKFDDPCTGDLTIDQSRVELLYGRIQALLGELNK